MSKSERVKVIECDYNKKVKIVVIVLKKLDGDEGEVKLAFRASDLPAAVGLEGEATEDAVILFCKNIKGKEINWVSQTTFNDLPDARQATDDQMWDITRELDKYPFPEVAGLDGTDE